MPLKSGSSEKVISQNIATEREQVNQKIRRLRLLCKKQGRRVMMILPRMGNALWRKHGERYRRPTPT